MLGPASILSNHGSKTPYLRMLCTLYILYNHVQQMCVYMRERERERERETSLTLDCFFVYIQIWSLTKKPCGVLLNDLTLYGDWVNCVLYSPSGRHILSASDNGLIKVHVHTCTDTAALVIYMLYDESDSLEWGWRWKWEWLHVSECSAYSTLPSPIYCPFYEKWKCWIWTIHCLLRSKG